MIQLPRKQDRLVCNPSHGKWKRESFIFICVSERVYDVYASGQHLVYSFTYMSKTPPQNYLLTGQTKTKHHQGAAWVLLFIFTQIKLNNKVGTVCTSKRGNFNDIKCSMVFVSTVSGAKAKYSPFFCSDTKTSWKLGDMPLPTSTNIPFCICLISKRKKICGWKLEQYLGASYFYASHR